VVGLGDRAFGYEVSGEMLVAYSQEKYE
jgi:hypothetical protein